MQSNYYSMKYVKLLSIVSIKRNPHGSCSISSGPLSLLMYSLIQMLLNVSPFICRAIQLPLNGDTLLFSGMLYILIKVKPEVLGFKIYLREKMFLSLVVVDTTWYASCKRVFVLEELKCIDQSLASFKFQNKSWIERGPSNVSSFLSVLLCPSPREYTVYVACAHTQANWLCWTLW